jgi:hypothetical protein
MQSKLAELDLGILPLRGIPMILISRMFPMIHTCRMIVMLGKSRTTLIVRTVSVSGEHDATGGGEKGEDADK